MYNKFDVIFVSALIDVELDFYVCFACVSSKFANIKRSFDFPHESRCITYVYVVWFNIN